MTPLVRTRLQSAVAGSLTSLPDLQLLSGSLQRAGRSADAVALWAALISVLEPGNAL